eukprot:gene9941-1020_t
MWCNAWSNPTWAQTCDLWNPDDTDMDLSVANYIVAWIDEATLVTQFVNHALQLDWADAGTLVNEGWGGLVDAAVKFRRARLLVTRMPGVVVVAHVMRGLRMPSDVAELALGLRF